MKVVVHENTLLNDAYQCGVVSVVEYAVAMENLNLSAIRTIRVLRPLRAINRIPSMFYRRCTCLINGRRHRLSA